MNNILSLLLFVKSSFLLELTYSLSSFFLSFIDSNESESLFCKSHEITDNGFYYGLMIMTFEDGKDRIFSVVFKKISKYMFHNLCFMIYEHKEQQEERIRVVLLCSF